MASISARPRAPPSPTHHGESLPWKAGDDAKNYFAFLPVFYCSRILLYFSMMDDDLLRAVEVHTGVPRTDIEIVLHTETDDSEMSDTSSCHSTTDTDGEAEPLNVFKGRKRKRDPSKWKRNIRKRRKAAGMFLNTSSTLFATQIVCFCS